MRIFLTVDTEVWPRRAGWPHLPLTEADDCSRQVAAYLWGGDREPRQGLPFMLATLSAHDLKATFFVDPLFSLALGSRPLRDVVDAIKAGGQEIGLHLHPEWLTDPRARGLPDFRGPLLHQYPVGEQKQLLGIGRELLEQAGADPVKVFRAGSWGADAGTLEALRDAGITLDSSLNACFAASFPSVVEGRDDLGAMQWHGITEYPATYFMTGPSTRRPLQLCACSLGEMQYVLRKSYEGGSATAVLVTHSFEMVRVPDLDKSGGLVGPRRLIGRRFERLCGFLAAHRDQFQTSHFASAAADADPKSQACLPVRSSFPRTMLRHMAQAVSTVY